MNAKAEAEAQYEKEFAKFVKKMKKARDASRDSGGSDNPNKTNASGDRQKEGKKKMNLVIKSQG